MIITHLTQDNSEVILFTSTSRTQNQDPIKIPFYNTSKTNNADERHTGSGIAIPYTTVSLYTTTESPHHHHRVPTPPLFIFDICPQHSRDHFLILVTHSHTCTHIHSHICTLAHTLHHHTTTPYCNPLHPVHTASNTAPPATLGSLKA